MTDVTKLLEDLQAVCDAATKGPWWYDELFLFLPDATARADATSRFIDVISGPPNQVSQAQGYADSAFIAQSRTAMPRLIEATRILRDNYIACKAYGYTNTEPSLEYNDAMKQATLDVDGMLELLLPPESESDDAKT